MKKPTLTNQKGITLIALVITIIILLILAGVTIAILTGENGTLNKAEQSKEETKKQTATEILNLKITNTQMATYTKEQRMPNLKELAISLDPENDKEIKSLTKQSTKMANLDWINDTDYTSIFAILKDYPEYEFEINDSLQLASVNGETVDNNITEPLQITENGKYNVKNYAEVDVDVPTYKGPKLVGIYNSEYGIKNNTVASIVINNLNVGEQYCVVIGRAMTGGANADFEDRGTTFTNAEYEKRSNYLYNFVPTATSVTITQATVQWGTNYGSRVHGFVFKGSFE